MSEMAALYGFGTGGIGGKLTVTAPVGATVTISKDGKTRTKTANAAGVAVFIGLDNGEWTVTITDGTQTATKTAAVTTMYAVSISFNAIPEFTYTGDYEIVNDQDEPISTSQADWKIRFLTSGTLTITSVNGAADGIDVFMVGGGGGGSGNKGGGGGGGYTKVFKVTPLMNTPYSIVIGAGGGSSSDGGNTSAFEQTVNGGKGSGQGPNVRDGGSGGSGGGSGASGAGRAGDGGSDGANGSKGSDGTGGTGQGTTTREFHESSNTLYSGGGGGYGYSSGASGGAGGGGDGGSAGKTNTGGGGGGGKADSSGGFSGGSGIVIIRNARGAA